jgi:crossover junction endodeoxyribonuclease RuvC
MGEKQDKIILGIDPGTNLMGFGVIRSRGKTPEFVDMGTVDLKKIPDANLKLRLILEKTYELIDRYLPDEVAIEAPFFGKNVQSMLKLGRAQGVAMAAVLSREIPVREYAPRKIKMAITGAGEASKEQVAGMLLRMFRLKSLPADLDATDGLAAAVCHFFQKDSPEKGSGPKSWEEYVRKNPGRVRDRDQD